MTVAVRRRGRTVDGLSHALINPPHSAQQYPTQPPALTRMRSSSIASWAPPAPGSRLAAVLSFSLISPSRLDSFATSPRHPDVGPSAGRACPPPFTFSFADSTVQSPPANIAAHINSRAESGPVSLAPAPSLARLSSGADASFALVGRGANVDGRPLPAVPLPFRHASLPPSYGTPLHGARPTSATAQLRTPVQQTSEQQQHGHAGWSTAALAFGTPPRPCDVPQQCSPSLLAAEPVGGHRSDIAGQDGVRATSARADQCIPSLSRFDSFALRAAREQETDPDAGGDNMTVTRRQARWALFQALACSTGWPGLADLILLMTDSDPTARPSAAEVAAHPVIAPFVKAFEEVRALSFVSMCLVMCAIAV